MEKSYVDKRIIFESVVGPRAYGTHNEDSDYDKAGVMIPDISYFFGWKGFRQYITHEPEDRVIHDIRKALKLFRENNPNMLDLLWIPEKCIIKSTKYWEKILSERSIFLSKRCRHTFSGYAFAQLKRIKSHRKFLLDPKELKPERSDFNLPESPIFPSSQLKAILYSIIEILPQEEKSNFVYELDVIYGDYVIPLLNRYIPSEDRNLAMEWLQIGLKRQVSTFLSIGNKYLKEEYIEVAKNELRYYNAINEWRQFQNWKKHRNKKRAALEEKIGYDGKHASHLVRLIQMGQEILETGKVNVDRIGIDADELKEIRNGLWPFDKVEEYAVNIDKKMGDLYKTSNLPYSPDEEKVQKLCVEVVDSYIREKG